jgi:two-component system, NtrC family, response regulator
MAWVLIIDDDRLMCRTLSEMVERMGHQACCAHTLQDGLRQVLDHGFDVVLLDVRLPDGNGLEIIPPIQATDSSPEVIIITGFGDADGAELAIKSGAWDYIQKPFSLKNMVLPLKRALQYREQKTARTHGVAVKALKREGIIGDGPRMRACFELLAQAANSGANVLIVGETGTGKELFARSIHENSPRSGHGFVVLDCAALPDALVESVLFGHVKGAFTGADVAREGVIAQAHRGTLFLDEVGELPLSMQKAFLRVLQEHRFRPVGDKLEKESDFRLIAATNRPIEKMTANGLFRQDLLFRLQGIAIELPPLRERREDIRDLAMHCLTRLCDRAGTAIKGISPEFMEALVSYEWPGNVRELFNAIEKAFVAAHQSAILYPKHLPTHVRVHIARGSIRRVQLSPGSPLITRAGPTYASADDLPAKPATWPETATNQDRPETYPEFRDFSRVAQREAEKHYLTDLLAVTHGNIKAACKASGLSQSRLYELLKKHGLTRFQG